MAAVGNYEIISTSVSIASGGGFVNGVLPAPPGKVVLAGFAEYSGHFNVLVWPEAGGTELHYHAYRSPSTPTSTSLSATVYATVAEMGN